MLCDINNPDRYKVLRTSNFLKLGADHGHPQRPHVARAALEGVPLPAAPAGYRRYSPGRCVEGEYGHLADACQIRFCHNRRLYGGTCHDRVSRRCRNRGPSCPERLVAGTKGAPFMRKAGSSRTWARQPDWPWGVLVAVLAIGMATGFLVDRLNDYAQDHIRAQASSSLSKRTPLRSISP